MPHTSSHPTPYRFHQAALAPLLPDATPADLEQACATAIALGEAAFADFLHDQGLAPMWDKLLKAHATAADQFSQSFKRSLHQARMDTTVNYLIQHQSLRLIRGILDDEGIAHVVYKGADIRERYYAEPALRPATDIDMLVAESGKVAAIRALQRWGFEFYGLVENISHEANLNRGMISIDLHWDILRPGRTRVSVVDALLRSRRDCGDHWGMSDEANLFVMLVHPVFVRYSTAPKAALMRMVDLAHVLARPDLDWREVFGLLDSAGLKTAAWITLRWLEVLTDAQNEGGVMEMLQPGKARRQYLDCWINRNLASRWQDKPIYVQLGLTLPAHDRLGDAIHAVRRARALRQSQQDDLEKLLANIAPD